MATYRANLPDLFETDQKRAFFKEFAMDPLLYRTILKIETSKTAHEDAFEMQGLGTFQLKPEGSPVSYSDPAQGPVKRVVHSTYSLGYRVSKEARADDQRGIINSMPKDLAESARDHQESLGWGVFNDAGAGTTHTGMDGVSLVNTAHTNVKGDQANRSNRGAAALSVTSLEAAVTNLRTTKSEEGRQIGAGLRPRWLIVPPDLEHTAVVLLDSTLKPGTDFNDVNTVNSSRHGASAFMVPYLTDSDDWFLVSDRHNVTWYDRQMLENDSNVDSQTKDTLFDANYRASVAIRGWIGVYGAIV